MIVAKRKPGRPRLGARAAVTTSLRLTPDARALLDGLRDDTDSATDVIVRALCALRIIESLQGTEKLTADDLCERLAELEAEMQ